MYIIIVKNHEDVARYKETRMRPCPAVHRAGPLILTPPVIAHCFGEKYLPFSGDPGKGCSG